MSEVVDPSRRAALTLHALPAVERDWIMRRLYPHQQQMMREQLGELGELGIVADQAFVDEALRPASGAKGAASPRQQLDRVSDADAVDLLENEPLALVGRLLGLQKWRWASAVLTHRGAALQRELATRRSSGHEAGADVLDEAMLALLVQRLHDVQRERRDVPELVGDTKVASSSSASRWRRWLR